MFEQKERAKRRTALFLSAALSAWAVVPVAAFAQEADAAAESDDDIIVTGTRVSGFQAPTPTTVLSTAQINLTGASTLTEAINQIPAFLPVNSPANTANSTVTAGANFLNLRALGNTRTLVLVNGRRFVPSGVFTSVAGAVDVNVIPAPLVKQVEVVTGGASAAWGSDAVAGVVNYILDTRYRGVGVEASAGISSRGDNAERRLSLVAGTGFADDKGSLVFGGEYFKSDGILDQRARDWSARGWQVIANPLATPTNSEFIRLLVPNVHQSNRTEGGLIVSAGPLRNLQFGPGGSVQPLVLGTSVSSTFMVGGDGINQGQYISLMVPNERQSAYGLLSYEFSPAVTARVEASYSRSYTNNQTTASFSFAPYTISLQNPFVPAPIRTIATANGITAFGLGRINTDFGYITAENEVEVYRVVGALDGDLGGGWSWDSYLTYGETKRDDRSNNNIVVSRLAASIDAIADPVTGQPVCRNAATNPGCVPVNLFGFGAPSAAAIDYFTEDQITQTKLRQTAAAVNVTGPVFDLPAGAVRVALGAEYRREQVVSRSDALANANAFLIGNPKNLRGSYNVKEVYGEVVIPLLKDSPIADALDLNGAVRLTDYSTSGGVTTWKIGATWDLPLGVRLRGTRSRDIRAPNITELFSVSGLSFANVRDPRNGSTPFISTVTGGNAGLSPEKANTWTVGAIVQPSFIPGLRLSVDYYNVKIDGAIGTITTQSLIDRCFTGGNQSLCALIDLNPDSSIRQVNNLFVNVQQLQTRGLDIEVDYRTKLGSGELGLRALATHVAELTTSDGITAIDRAGQPQGTGVPHWTGFGSISYEQGPATVSLSGRYVGGGVWDTTFGPRDINVLNIPSRFYVNLAGEVTVLEKGERRLALYGSIRNLFDKDPPIIASTFQAPPATNGALFDVVGRFFTLGVRVRY